MDHLRHRVMLLNKNTNIDLSNSGHSITLHSQVNIHPYVNGIAVLPSPPTYLLPRSGHQGLQLNKGDHFYYCSKLAEEVIKKAKLI